MQHVYVTRETLTNIHLSIGNSIPETGGILGSKNGLISYYFFDQDALVSSSCYIPSASIEKIIRCWRNEGISFEGFIHSHVGRYFPTQADISYSSEVMGWYEAEFGCEKTKVLIPIVQSIYNGTGFKVHCYSSDRFGRISQCELCIQENEGALSPEN